MLKGFFAFRGSHCEVRDHAALGKPIFLSGSMIKSPLSSWCYFSLASVTIQSEVVYGLFGGLHRKSRR